GWQDPRIVKTAEVADWEPIVLQLERLGVRPEDVDTIVLSHVHFDHAGQLGHFPKATVYLQKAEMDFIKFVQGYREGPTKARLRGSFLRVDADTLAVIEKEGRLQLVDGYGDLGPGLQIVPALNTHSPGCQMLVVNTVSGPMVLAGDAVYERGNITHANPMGTNMGSNLECILNFEKILDLAGGKIEMVIPAHDPAIFSYWPSWKMGETYVTEIALTPGQRSLKPG
ncbi:MAG: N-acyl homoserine lactonase family protein, partial [Dehalococcoidia bacterium]|nr:N-acyl homoserine lactonase family protein [Dehalococcoidia bacterium]